MWHQAESLFPGVQLSWLPVLYSGGIVGHGLTTSAILALSSKTLRCPFFSKRSCIFLSSKWVLWYICWASWVVKSDGRMIYSSVSWTFLSHCKCLCISGFLRALAQWKLEILAAWVLLSLVVCSAGWLPSGGQPPLLLCLPGCFSSRLGPFLSGAQGIVWQLSLRAAYMAYKTSKISCLLLAIFLQSTIPSPGIWHHGYLSWQMYIDYQYRY